MSSDSLKEHQKKTIRGFWTWDKHPSHSHSGFREPQKTPKNKSKWSNSRIKLKRSNHPPFVPQMLPTKLSSLLSSQPSSGWRLKTLVETDISFGFGGLVALTFYIDVSVWICSNSRNQHGWRRRYQYELITLSCLNHLWNLYLQHNNFSSYVS